MLSVIMLSVIMLSVIMLSVIMLSVRGPTLKRLLFASKVAEAYLRWYG
jgi:hypothetical protein